MLPHPRRMRHAVFIVSLLTVSFGQFAATALVLLRHADGREYAEGLRATARDDERREELSHLVIPTALRLETTPAFERVGRDEVLFDGHLYDVVYEEVRGDSLHLWGYWDLHEEEAVLRLAQANDGSRRDAGVTVVSPYLRGPGLFYVSLLSAAMRPAPAGCVRYTLDGAPAAAAPFGKVPHPPPRG